MAVDGDRCKFLIRQRLWKGKSSPKAYLNASPLRDMERRLTAIAKIRDACLQQLKQRLQGPTCAVASKLKAVCESHVASVACEGYNAYPGGGQPASLLSLLL